MARRDSEGGCLRFPEWSVLTLEQGEQGSGTRQGAVFLQQILPVKGVDVGQLRESVDEVLRGYARRW